MEVRPLTSADASKFRQLRRERLEQSPRAFGESLAEHDALPLETLAARLGKGTGDNFVIGAFTSAGDLVGIAGFSRSPRLKSRHKGLIWGVYVRAQSRAKGVGRAILTELLKRARAEPGLEQITLSVSCDQNSARSLYVSLGFEKFGHEKHALKVDGSYVDEDHMVLWLK